MILDGTIISADRCRDQTLSVQGQLIDVWYSGKAHVHGGNIQAVTAPDGFPLWVSAGTTSAADQAIARSRIQATRAPRHLTLASAGPSG